MQRGGLAAAPFLFLCYAKTRPAEPGRSAIRPRLVTAAVAVRTAVPATAATLGNVNHLIGIGRRALERRSRHGLGAECNEREESGDRGEQSKFFTHGVILPVGLTPEN
jgi:hypothetical protein